MEKVCSKCKESKLLNNYYAKNKNNMCKKCINTLDAIYRDTKNGFFSMLARSCKNHSKRRLHRGDKNNRKSRGIYEINFEFLKNKYDEQNKKCYYSGIEMNINSYAIWKCSPERLNDNIGYTEQNTVLVCSELNNSTKWSIEKIRQIPKLINKYVSQEYLDNFLNYNLSKKTTRQKINKETIDGIEYWKCNVCNLNKLKKDMTTTSGCNSCQTKRTKEYRNTPMGFLKKLILASKKRSKLKKMKFNLNDKFIYELYRSQNGKCHYSNIPLVLKSKSDWQASIERKDVKKGYTQDNVCLICLEFNGTDCSGSKNRESLNGENDTSGGWNKQKFHYFLQHIIKKIDNINVTIEEVEIE